MLIVGIKKPNRPIRYFWVYRLDVSYGTGPVDVEIVALCGGKIHEYLMEGLGEPRYFSTFDIISWDQTNRIECYRAELINIYTLGAGGPEDKIRIEFRAQQYRTSRERRVVIKKLFLSAEA